MQHCSGLRRAKECVQPKCKINWCWIWLYKIIVRLFVQESEDALYTGSFMLISWISGPFLGDIWNYRLIVLFGTKAKTWTLRYWEKIGTWTIHSKPKATFWSIGWPRYEAGLAARRNFMVLLFDRIESNPRKIWIPKIAEKTLYDSIRMAKHINSS